MTVASTLNKKQYQGNSLTTEFPLPFHVTAKEHIFALLKKGTAIHEIKNNFAVDLERKVFIYPVQGEPIKTGESLTVYRKIPLTQIVDLENAGAFHPEVLEHDGFDRIVMQIQQIDEEISRSLKIDITDTRDVTNLLEELFKAREEAVLSAQKALMQAERATDKAEKTENWALFAEEKVKELTDLEVYCFISNDGQGQVHYDKDEHKLEIILPFDNSGSSQSKIILTDSINLARSDIGASARAVQSLQAKINQEMSAALAAKLDKASLSDAINNPSSANAASSAAVNNLRLAVADLAMPSLDYFEFTANSLGDDKYNTVFTAPANGYGFIHTRNIPANTSVPEISIGHVKYEGNKYIQIGLGSNIMYRRAVGLPADTLHFSQTFMPLMKGEEYSFYSQGFAEVHFGFFYLQGEI